MGGNREVRTCYPFGAGVGRVAIERCYLLPLWGRGWAGGNREVRTCYPFGAGVGWVAIERCVPVTPLGQGLGGWQ